MSGAVAGEARARVRWPLTRKMLLWAGAGAAALAASAWGAEYWTTGQYIESTDDAYVGGNVSTLAPQVSGLVAQVAVTDNQFVHKGQLLIKLDDAPYRAALAKALANVAGAESTLANLAAQAREQHAVIAQAQADVVAADAAVVLARDNQARYARLAASEAGTVQDAQTADATLAQNVAGAEKCRATLDAARLQLGVIATRKQQALANLQAAQAALQTARLNEGYTEIRAPFNGVVGNRAAHVGDYASAGTDLISLVPSTGLWVDANFKEDQIANMHPGQTVNISADIDPGVKITGHVLTLAPASGAVFSLLPPENATGNFTKIVQRVPVRIALDGGAGALGLLRPGLSVTASVNTK